MIICKNCSETLNDDILFCPFCGHKVEKEKTEDKKVSLLKHICVSDKMFDSLFPIIHNSNSYRAIYHGNTGTLKEETIDKLANLLYQIGKLKDPKPTYKSFIDMPENPKSNLLYVIEDIELAINNLFNLDDFSDEASTVQVAYKEKLNQIIHYKSDSYIIINVDSARVNAFTSLNSKIDYIFEHRIGFDDLNDEDVYELFKSYLSDNQRDNLNDKAFKNTFLSYLRNNRKYLPFENKELAMYLANYSSTKTAVTLPPNRYDEKTLEKAFENIVGMENLKEQAIELEKYLKFNAEVSANGIKLPDLRLHMMFLGDPGTGKTTVARILGRVLFDLGYIRENKFIETTSADFVGVYSNQTSIKTSRLINHALGGVLFIDEAYSLSNSSGKAGEEAIALLVKAMEDYRDDLVIFLAGYTKEMGMFLKSNSGLASRINYYFKFENYTEDELKQIFNIKLRNTGLKYIESEESITKLERLIQFASTQKDSGNGRFVDKVLQKVLTKHAERVADLQVDPYTIIADDIPDTQELMKSFY